MIHGLRTARVGKVAGGANRTEPAELADGSAFVAAFALERPVGAQKRETVCVTVRAPHDIPPAACAVALFAVTSELAPVDVRVTIGALSADV